MGLRSSYGVGRYVAVEGDVVLGRPESFLPGSKKPLAIYCHGAGATALSAFHEPNQQRLMRNLAAHYTVVIADLGGNTFGNDTVLTRIGQVKTYAQNVLGTTGPALMVGASMGTISSLVYARANPSEVRGVLCAIPGLDIADLLVATATSNPNVPPLINAAYGGAYSDTTHGPTHSPIQFADELDPSIPIEFWYAPNDTQARSGPVLAFKAAAPQVQIYSIGNLNHTNPAIGAAVPGITQRARELIGAV